MQKYKLIRHQYLGFYLQAYKLRQEAAYKRLGITFLAKQQGLVADIILEVKSQYKQQQQVALRARVNIEKSSSKSSSKSSNKDKDNKNSYIAVVVELDIRLLNKAVFQLLVSLVRQKVSKYIYKSLLICFLAAAKVQIQLLEFAELHLYIRILAAVLQ